MKQLTHDQIIDLHSTLRRKVEKLGRTASDETRFIGTRFVSEPQLIIQQVLNGILDDMEQIHLLLDTSDV